MQASRVRSAKSACSSSITSGGHNRTVVSPEALGIKGIRVLAEVPLTLEDLFLELIRGARSRKVWRPHLSAA